MDLNKTEETKSAIPQMGNAQSEIRQIAEDFREAALSMDIEKVMSFYAPDVIAYDIVAPLVYKGKEEYRKSWERAFSEMPNSEASIYHLHDLKVFADEHIAFCHGLNHCGGEDKNGIYGEMWMRSTQCFKKIDGKWLIVHEQFSVPVDFESEKALFNLTPEKSMH